jgi:hypothetical protein
VITRILRTAIDIDQVRAAANSASATTASATGQVAIDPPSATSLMIAGTRRAK